MFTGEQDARKWVVDLLDTLAKDPGLASARVLALGRSDLQMAFGILLEFCLTVSREMTEKES